MMMMIIIDNEKRNDSASESCPTAIEKNKLGTNMSWRLIEVAHLLVAFIDAS